ncbi:MAG: triose-phosphate isomerase [Candidatus Cloacimonetes bacterium 4572_55]|nr:MAG: triose-phosphate isomerase [Candidatus Cloacimonetes bacterium 4572_55]
MRRPFIAGNWKMNLLAAEANSLADGIVKDMAKNTPQVDVALCPPATYLATLADVCRDSRVRVGAQNLHWESSGAYTGELSGQMLKDVGCFYVIIGHSERRQYFGETNESVNRKLKAALQVGLHPIVCVGETLDERQQGVTQKVIRQHVVAGYDELSKEHAEKTVIAYEPVWAIGTGMTATPDQAQETHAFIRSLLVDLFGSQTAESIRIQYGGSVKPGNVDDLMAKPDIDGALVGGASLKIDPFCRIIRFQS